MRTLARWVDRLSTIPSTIECPNMQIIGRDHELPLFTGPGHIYIRSRTKIEFVMHAIPRDGGEAFKRLACARDNPYELLHQFRLLATEYDGTEWACGWASVQLGESSAKVWRLSGLLQSLMTGVSGDWVALDSSVELVYDIKLRLPIPMNMVTTVLRDGDEVLYRRGPGRKIVDVVGTSIEFFHAPENDMIWATAKTSTEFHHPYAENWISEPLRLLLGQLVFPRFVARNKGDGTATVWMRPSPDHTGDTLISSILGQDPHASPEQFWGLYQDILTMVANARDGVGSPNFEAHPMTQFYHEISQATSGSHWVLCMTLSSIVEGIVKMLADPDQLKSDYDPGAIDNLKSHIKQWKGDNNLQSRTIGFLEFAKEKGIKSFLKSLCKSGVLDAEHERAWSSVRNQVMHGNLVSPWLDEETEKRLKNITELVHRLSLAYVKKCVSQVDYCKSNT